MNQLIRREAITHSLLEHPNIIPFLGVCREGVTKPPMIVLPYIENGSLEEFMDRNHVMGFLFTKIVSFSLQSFSVSSI
jgi:serine/threonine protein kinase